MAQSQILNAGGRSNPNIEEQFFDSNATDSINDTYISNNNTGNDDSENEPHMSVDEENLEEDTENDSADIVDLDYNVLKLGFSFSSKDIAIGSLKKFFTDNYHPMIISSGGAGRLRWMCTHAHKRKYYAGDSRPCQRVNFTSCLAGVIIN